MRHRSGKILGTLYVWCTITPQVGNLWSDSINIKSLM